MSKETKTSCLKQQYLTPFHTCYAISIASAIAIVVDCGRFWRISPSLNFLDLSWMSFNCTPHSSHRLLNPGIFNKPTFPRILFTKWMKYDVCILILLLTVITKLGGGGGITGSGLLFTASYKAGGPINGAGLLFSLFLSRGCRCWDRFAIYSFCYAVSWNWSIYATVGMVLVFCCMGYNLKQPSRMLSCTQHHCIIGVKSLQNSFWHLLGPPKFPTSLQNG